MSIVIAGSLTELVKTKLREMIIHGELAFGQQLTESKLSTQFGVSKTPIREALAQLKEEGLVAVRARCGTFVYGPDAADLQLITEIRCNLEVGALRLAYEKNNVPLVQALGRIVKQMAKGYDQSSYHSYLELDTEFHKTIIEYADNKYYSAAYNIIATKVQALRHRIEYDNCFLARSTRGHISIYEGIRDDRIEETCGLLHGHISRVFQQGRSRFIDLIPGSSPG
ncbi:MAG: GntR family transcriptional regulator [Desulfovibrionaceae bacterium]|jgi:DNA-binding GntR family transcriptional regulator|nr:GntR family transcriptional regulator [Desulfovibrionaceae bacterium]